LEVGVAFEMEVGKKLYAHPPSIRPVAGNTQNAT
jgi:hypothetical protein